MVQYSFDLIHHGQLSYGLIIYGLISYGLVSYISPIIYGLILQLILLLHKANIRAYA